MPVVQHVHWFELWRGDYKNKIEVRKHNHRKQASDEAMTVVHLFQPNNNNNSNTRGVVVSTIWYSCVCGEIFLTSIDSSSFRFCDKSS